MCVCVKKTLSSLKPFFSRTEKQLDPKFKIIHIAAVQIGIDYHSSFSMNRESD